MLNIQAGTNRSMRRIIFLFSCLLIYGCKSTSVTTSNEIKLKFLDEFVLPDDVIIDGTLVGGLSGIDYQNGKYVLVCDDASNPRYYEAKIDIINDEISSVVIQKVIQIKDSVHFLDLESIRFNSNKNEILLTSEGNINMQKSPVFFSVDSLGNVVNEFDIPSEFHFNSVQKPRHNGTLEGLTKSIGGKGYWIAMELPLELDGPEPDILKTNSPVRITYFDALSLKLEKQFSYKLDSIAKPPKEKFAINGLTDILEYDNDKFFIIERSYSSGLGNQGNTVKIFDVNASQATNTIAIHSLQNNKYRSASKELIFDFEEVRDKLTNYSIDNIEGISFGPILPNGNRTIILVSDNNFNQLGVQLNQFILLELID